MHKHIVFCCVLILLTCEASFVLGFVRSGLSILTVFFMYWIITFTVGLLLSSLKQFYSSVLVSCMCYELCLHLLSCFC